MQQRDQMHPQDMRNLIIFAVLSIAMWLVYDHFVARPHAEQMRLAAARAKAVAIANAPTDILETAIVKPREEMIADNPRIKIETESVEGSINLTGARLDDFQLKNYYKTVEKKERVATLSPARTAFPRYVETGWVGPAGMTNLPNDETVWNIKGANNVLTPSTPVTLSATLGGLTFEKIFSIDNDFGLTVENRVVNKTGREVTLYPYALATEHGQPEDFLNQNVIHEGPLGYFGDRLEERRYKDFKKKPQETFDAEQGWIGLTGKYWLTAVSFADQGAENMKFRFVSSPAVNDKTKDRYQTDITGAAKIIANGDEATSRIYVFSGAKKVKLLESYQKKWNAPHFELAVDFGWFWFLTKPFFFAINFLYQLIGNFGIAIIIFTCCLRVLVFPLANTSYRSFAKMRMVSPEMYNLRAQYKDDKQKLQEELVKLYQKHNVNPMAGCFPILIQIPIFFALYKVLSNTIEMRHAPFYGWIHDLSAMDPTTVFNLFGLIPWTPPHILMIGAWPLMMMVGMILQRNISPPPEDPIQAKLIQIMPYFMTFVMAKFAAGLVIYWTFNNLLAIIQQIVIMKSMGVPIHLFSKDKIQKDLEKEVSEGPMINPSLEMIEEEIEEAVHDGEAKILSKPKPKKKKKK
ncbi:MAG: membrane protein insertase YidC [Micavibrio aeruginosavorus]|uniref:Membrane protein insertase YidC n=1 Tax=Micavibrio aeruginosavorus TaxID=349221 RepID=A0A2W5NEF1_9BACT|nr:MAG: membrane protein insertase YidC [Micavibrio aeruginosavorus]